ARAGRRRSYFAVLPAREYAASACTPLRRTRTHGVYSRRPGFVAPRPRASRQTFGERRRRRAFAPVALARAARCPRRPPRRSRAPEYAVRSAAHAQRPPAGPRRRRV